MPDLYIASIKHRFDHLLRTLKSDRFLSMEGLGNEVPFFLFAYPAKQQLDIEEMCKSLVKRLSTEGIKVLNINLYDTAVELLKSHGTWEVILEDESEFLKTELMEDLQSSLSPEQHMIPAIEAKAKAAGQFDILFLTGVGQVFPFIRSHTILNNLQSKAKTFPTLMWFPGEYTYSVDAGSSLDLFSQLHDDKYYRAFNILNYQIH